MTENRIETALEETPILDDHLHLDPERGQGIEAVEAFADAGGTHLLIVNQPSWKHGIEVSDPEEFRPVFERTIQTVETASAELPGRAWPVLGVHPGLISRVLERGLTPEDAAGLMQAGLDIAAEYTARGDALALKSGRPHYEVDDAVWEASNGVLRHALECGADSGVPVQLHTESTDDLSEVAAWAADAGLPRERVVKHYAGGSLEGGTPSVIAHKEALERAVDTGERFLMETDFLDDSDRPGAVLGPQTVPRRVRWLLETGYSDAVQRAHVETPKRVYGVDTHDTLG